MALACIGVVAFIAGYRALKMPFMDLGPDRAMENPLLAVDGPHRLLGSLDVLAFYLRHTATGVGLAPDYSFSEPPILRDGASGVVLGAGFAIGCAALCAASWNRRPRIADATLALGASYVAVSNVFVGASAIADRFFFFPSFWLVIIVAMILDEAVRARGARLAVGAAAVVFTMVQARNAAAYASPGGAT